MRARTVVVALLVVAAAAACVRLGVWQLARRAEKHAWNVALDRALAAPPETLADALVPADAVRGRRVALRGAFDLRRQVLLSAREHLGEPGVHIATPFVVAGGTTAVLVDRGWLPAADAVTARPADYPAADTVVAGLADSLGRAGRAGTMRVLAAGDTIVWSAERLDRDTLAVRLPYAVAAFTVTELPPAAAPLPALEPAPRHDEAMHLSYAIQWFAFAIIVLVGPAALAWSRRPRTQGGQR